METAPKSASLFIRLLLSSNRTRPCAGCPGLRLAQRLGCLLRTVIWAATFILLPAANALAAPEVLWTQPPNDAVDIPGERPLVIHFNTRMDPDSTIAQIYDGASLFGVEASWSVDGQSLTNTPTAPLPEGKTISWRIIGRSATGDLLPFFTGTFTVGSGSPYIASISPAPYETNAPLNAPVVVTFSSAMNITETQGQFRNTSAFPPAYLDMQTSWNDARTEARFAPAKPYPPLTRISWMVFGSNARGLELVGTTIGMFMTGTGLQAPPVLLSTTPTNGSIQVPPSAPIVFRFNTAMNTNRTSPKFWNGASPLTFLGVSSGWSADQRELACAPSPPLPGGAFIAWTLDGEDTNGTVLPTSSGFFQTAAVSQTNPPTSALLSRGESLEQTGPDFLQAPEPEFTALAGAESGGEVMVASPLSGRTCLLGLSGAAGALEFDETEPDSAAFATNYPPGDYRLTIRSGDLSRNAIVNLSSASLPMLARPSQGGTTPHIILGQPGVFHWTCEGPGEAVDYARVRIEQDGAVLFTTPMPHQPGALTGASNSVVVPSAVFTHPGRAEARLTTFRFSALDTNSLPGVSLYAATHRTISFDIRIVDGSTPPPTLLTTNLAGVPVAEPFLNPLFAKAGVRPLRYELIGGALPPGLSVDRHGNISGTAAAVGSFQATLRLTDLLGRASTQTLALATVPLPPQGAGPRVVKAALEPTRTLALEVLGTAGAPFTLERSLDLNSWLIAARTNSSTERFTWRVPTDGSCSFYRVRGSSAPLPQPHPLKVTPRLNTNACLSAVVGEAGGALRLTNAAGYAFSLNIPAGALGRDETITMTDVAQISGLPMEGGLNAAVQLEPEGLVFQEPARLDITAPHNVDQSRLLTFNARHDGSEFALQPGFGTNRTLSLYLQHFSLQGAGSGSADGAQGQASSNPPSDPQTAMTQQVASQLAACRADPSCAQDLSGIKDDLIKTYIQMADQVVIPRLQQALPGTDDSAVDNALATWLQWLRDMQLLGLYDGGLFGSDELTQLQNRIRRAGSLASQVLANGIKQCCEKCLAHDVWRIYRMLKLTRMASLLGLNYESEFWSCARRCLVFEIKVESEIVGSDGGRLLSTHTKAKAKLRPVEDDDFTRLLLVLKGAGQWEITSVQMPALPPECVLATASVSGQLKLPWVKINLYRERQVWVPGEPEPRTVYSFDPDMTLNIEANLGLMPKEGQTLTCKGQPAKIADRFGPLFFGFHNDEVVTPSGLEAQVMGGPVFRMTGFVPGGPQDVILSKSYLRTLDTVTENTLIELRHTPQ